MKRRILIWVTQGFRRSRRMISEEKFPPRSIDEPSAGAHYGGDVAGPVFASVMGGALRTLGIPHDIPLQVAQETAAGKAKAGKEKL